MSKAKRDFYWGIIEICVLLLCIASLSPIIKVISGTCVLGLELWGYRIGIVSWFAAGILLDRKLGRRNEAKRRR